MKPVTHLSVKYHDLQVGLMSLTPDNRLCTFEYDKEWLAEGFSISPLELPLKPGIFMEISAYLKTVSPTDMEDTSFIRHCYARV